VLMGTFSDGKEPKPGNNEPNRNPGFAKNRTRRSKMCKNTNRTERYPVKNWIAPKPKCHGSYWVLSLNEIAGRAYIHTFHSQRDILLYLGQTSSRPA